MSDQQDIIHLLQLIDNVMTSDSQVAKDALRKFMMVASLAQVPEGQHQNDGPLMTMITSLCSRVSSLEAQIKTMNSHLKTTNRIYDKYANNTIIEDFYTGYNNAFNIGGSYGSSIDEYKKLK
jgi:hypothetical protein